MIGDPIARARIIEVKSDGDSQIRPKKETSKNSLIRTDTERRSLRPFAVPENPAPHNSLLMDAAAKLISTTVRKPTEYVTRERKFPGTKEVFSCLKEQRAKCFLLLRDLIKEKR